MSQTEPNLKQMLTRAGPYPLAAYNFVREGLGYTVEQSHGNHDDEMSALQSGDHHINGQQLCLGLRDYAIEQYGMLAPAVLSHWNIHRTDDFGRIVFAMIDAGLMSKTDEDTVDDFRAVYNFQEAFSREQLLAHLACRVM